MLPAKQQLPLWLLAVTLQTPAYGWFDGTIGRHLPQDKLGAYSAFASDSFSEVMSIDALIDDFRGPLEPGHIAYTYNSAEVGIAYQGWRLARILRYDYALTFSEDTALLNYQIERGGSASIDRSRGYDLLLKADHIRSQGVLIGKSFDIPLSGRTLGRFEFKYPLKVDIEFTYLKSTQYYDGWIRGTLDEGNLTEAALLEFSSELEDLNSLNVTGFSDIAAEGERLQLLANDLREIVESSDLYLEVDYSYYEPALREDEIEQFADDIAGLNPQGRGYTIALQFQLQLTDRWQVQLGIHDLLSSIEWDDTGNTKGSLYATQASLDALDVVDQFIQQDLINRFSGSSFQPLNPDNPDDPEAVLPEIEQQIIIDNANIQAYKGSHTQTLPTRTWLQTDYQVTDWCTAIVGYQHNTVADFWNLGTLLFDHFYLGYEPETSSLRVGLTHRYASLLLQSDDSDIDQAKRLALAGSIYLLF